MSDILLTGLEGSHPLGFLAALGLLRCCQEVEALGPLRLSWKKESDWLAVLHAGRPRSATDLLSGLVARQQGRPDSPELTWAKNIKTAPEIFRDAARSAAASTTPTDRRYADFLAAFTCDLATNFKGDLEPTAFYMTSGRQEFLKEACGLAGRLASGVSLNRQRKGPEEMFREALFGPWKYEDPQHSLGWDPSTERLHALRSQSPTREPSAGVAAAVWLAFEALPLFPCFLSGGRLATRGFSRLGDRTVFTWPIWTAPASLATVGSLLALEELTREDPPQAELCQRGVAAVFRSERYKVKTQGNYFILRPSFPCIERTGQRGGRS
jgi:hypothetical protein